MHGTFIVFRKELRDTLRDRRTLVAMVVVPLVLLPLLIVGGSWLDQSQMEDAAEKSIQVAVLGTESQKVTLFHKTISAAPTIHLVTDIPEDTARARVRSGSLDAAVVFAESFRQRVKAERAGTVDLIYTSDDDSKLMLERLRSLLDQYEQQLLERRFSAIGTSTEATEAGTLNEVDLALEKILVAQQMGGLLPNMFLIFCFTGAMYPALDMGAGEKERGTLETLFTAPVSRCQFLIGKTLTIIGAGLFAAIVSILSILGSVWFIEDIPDSILEAATSILTPGVVGVLLSLLVPLTIFFAATQLSLSFYAKSLFREAQIMVSPLLIAVIFPAFIGLLPGFSLNATTALIPAFGVSGFSSGPDRSSPRLWTDSFWTDTICHEAHTCVLALSTGGMEPHPYH